VEKIPGFQFDGILPLRPELEPQTSGDEKPVEIPFTVVVPIRDDRASATSTFDICADAPVEI